MCGSHRRTCERLWNFSLSSLWRKKKWQRNKELTTVKFEPGTAGSEITELPTKSHEALDEFRQLKRLFCVWYVLVSSSCRYAFFATSIFEIRNSKFVVFQYVNKRVCPLPGNCLVVHGDVPRRMICWKKTFTNSLVEVTASENVREKVCYCIETEKNNDVHGGKSKFYRKRGSASYIVREVRSVRERKRDTERERERERESETKVTSP